MISPTWTMCLTEPGVLAANVFFLLFHYISMVPLQCALAMARGKIPSICFYSKICVIESKLNNILCLTIILKTSKHMYAYVNICINVHIGTYLYICTKIWMLSSPQLLHFILLFIYFSYFFSSLSVWMLLGSSDLLLFYFLRSDNS